MVDERPPPKEEADGAKHEAQGRPWQEQVLRVALPIVVIFAGITVKLAQELQLEARVAPPLMGDAELEQLFEAVFKAGSQQIRDWKAVPVVFTSIDARGRFGPTRSMKKAYPVCKHIAQNKLLHSYGSKKRSKHVRRGPVPYEHIPRQLVSQLAPPLFQLLEPWARNKKTGEPIAFWFLKFANRYKLWYLGYQGAVPVFHAQTGDFVAAFAASGATGKQDEDCVDAGLKAAGLRRRADRWLWLSAEEAEAAGWPAKPGAVAAGASQPAAQPKAAKPKAKQPQPEAAKPKPKEGGAKPKPKEAKPKPKEAKPKPKAAKEAPGKAQPKAGKGRG